MSNSQIAFLVCGIIFLLFSILLIWYLIYRIKHPYTIEKIENTSWFIRWIRVNINVILSIATVMTLVSSIAFFTMLSSVN